MWWNTLFGDRKSCAGQAVSQSQDSLQISSYSVRAEAGDARPKHASVFYPMLAGIGIAAILVGGKRLSVAYQAWKNRPATPLIANYWEGGFHSEMNKREASRILGIRYGRLLSLILHLI